MLELEYIESTDEYNISGNKYSVEEAETIAHFITSKEFDKYVQKNPTYLEQIIPNELDALTVKYTQQDVDNDDAQQEINYKRGQ
jgi:hypothetical protein